MKNTILMAAASIIFSAAQAQVTDSSQGNTTTTDASQKLNAYGSYSTRDSIAAKYKLLPMPGPLTIDKTFPVLGTYQLSANAGTNTQTKTQTITAGTSDMNATATDATVMPMVTISLDSASKGMVWIDGLPQGRMKAFLKKSPSSYRIIAQKTESGTSVPEGTLVFDPETNILNIALGSPYNDQDPAGVFALSAGTTPTDNTAEVKVKTKNTKVKQKITFYTASKVVADEQMQQQQNNSFNQGLQQATDNQN